MHNLRKAVSLPVPCSMSSRGGWRGWRQWGKLGAIPCPPAGLSAASLWSWRTDASSHRHSPAREERANELGRRLTHVKQREWRRSLQRMHWSLQPPWLNSLQYNWQAVGKAKYNTIMNKNWENNGSSVFRAGDGETETERQADGHREKSIFSSSWNWWMWDLVLLCRIWRSHLNSNRVFNQL